MLICIDWSLSFQVIVKWQGFATSYFERKNMLRNLLQMCVKIDQKCKFLLKNGSFSSSKSKNVHYIERQPRQILCPVHYIESHLCSTESVSSKMFTISRGSLYWVHTISRVDCTYLLLPNFSSTCVGVQTQFLRIYSVIDAIYITLTEKYSILTYTCKIRTETALHKFDNFKFDPRVQNDMNANIVRCYALPRRDE